MLVRPSGGGSACPSDSQDTDRRKGRRREKRAFPYLDALCPHKLSSVFCIVGWFKNAGLQLKCVTLPHIVALQLQEVFKLLFKSTTDAEMLYGTLLNQL